MKLIVFVLIPVLFLTCKSKTVEVRVKSKSQLVNEIYSEIDFFKYSVFRECLKTGYNNSDIITELLSEEILLTDFPYGIQTMKNIKHYAADVRTKIITDSIYLKRTWLLKNTDYENITGKRVIAHCLEFYISAELDSIANKYKINDN